MGKPLVLDFDGKKWAKSTAKLIMDSVLCAQEDNGVSSVMLTGGRSASVLYQAWAALPNFNQMHNVNFYFGDERSVLPTTPESNYNLVMSTLFSKGVPSNCKVIRIRAEESNLLAVAEDYEKHLPARIDVLLLSMGEDGHIASLFPFNSALNEVKKLVVPTKSPKPPSDRITITPALIKSARDTFILALGEQKRILYQKLQTFPSAYDVIPARLVLNGTWIFGD
jgi:6-phosphogluconolactonase